MTDVKRYRLGDLLVSDMAGSFADDFMIDASDYDTLVARLVEAGAWLDEVATLCVTAERRVAELEARQGEQKPIGYINKKDLARLTDEITWDGSYLTIGVDHFAQWLEDTPYDHLTPIYSAPPPAPEVAGLATAAKQVIEMNRQHAKDQYGDANKAESWSCVTVLRAALAAHEQQAGGNTDE